MSDCGPSRRCVLATGVGVAAGVLASGTARGSAPANAPTLWDATATGFNIGTFKAVRHDSAFLAAVSATGARLARLFVEFVWDASLSRYALPQGTLPALQQVLRQAHTVGLKLVLVGDFETAPNPTLWGHAARATAFVQAWRILAIALKDSPALAGYDLLNEPNPPWTGGVESAARLEWRTLAWGAIQAIRRQDALVPIVFEGVGGGQAVGLRGLLPFDAEHVVYSFHFYSPHGITHQQVAARWPHRIAYPALDGAALVGSDAHPGPWGLVQLRAAMQDAIDFQQQHQRPVWVGEFSCVRWAPGASAFNYVNDCLTLFGQQGWPWCYHEFRGWPGWDAEVASNDPLVTQRSHGAPIMRLLQQKMSRPVALAVRPSHAQPPLSV